MSDNQRQFSAFKPALVDLAYLALSSLHDSEGWSKYLKGFCEYFNANLSHISLFGDQFQFGSTSIYYGFTQQEISEWHSDWLSRDPWMKGRNLSSLPKEMAVPSHHLCSDEDLISQDIYKAFLEPRQLHYGAGVNYLVSGDVSAVQMVLRPREVGPFSESELEDWNRLIPYVKAALRSSLEQSRLQAENELFSKHFASLGAGLFVLTPEARVMRSNSAANEVVARRTDILIQDGQLSFTRPSVDEEFRKALRRLATEKNPEWHKIAVRADQTLDTPPLLAILSAVPHTSIFKSFSILLYLVESRPASAVDSKVFEKLFGWTPTEAKLAALLAAGHSLEEAAGQLNFSKQTGRTHLKHLFTKTGFTRQGELIVLINQLSLRDPLR